MNLYLLVLVLYSLLLAGLGAYLARGTRTAGDFFVANRALGPGLLFSTLLAANIGAGSTVGAAGLGYRLGLSGWWWVGSAGIGSLVLAFTVGPRLWELARRHGFLTVGDFLEFRYDRRMRGVVAAILWLGTLTILAGQLIAVATILNAVAGTSKVIGCLLGGVIVILYFSAGGLRGAARINLLQLVVKAAGFALALPAALALAGGWSQVRQVLYMQPRIGDEFFQMTGIGGSGILSYVLLLAPAFIISPGLLQKIYGARDRKAVRRGTALQGVALLLFSFFPVVLGMVAAAQFPGLENPEQALPAVVVDLLPFWLGALLLASVFSAELSSADAILFMLSTSLGRDLYQTFIRPTLPEEKLLSMSRWISVSAGAMGVLLAILIPTVIDALTIFYSLMTVSLFIPLLFGIYTRYAAAGSVLLAALSAVAVTAPVHLLTDGQGIGVLSPTALGIAVSLAVVLISYVRR